MDLDRLHEDYLFKPSRASGRTYDMLLTVAQHADWPDVSPILVVCSQAPEDDRLMYMLAEIAHDMGYSSQVLAHGRMLINTTLVRFRPVSSLRDQVGYAKVFEDHFVTDVYYGLHRMYPGAEREAFRPPPDWPPLEVPKIEWEY